MPKFVKENSLDESELEEQVQNEKERLEKQFKEEKRERKTLKDQLRESREKKYREYQENLGSQNSSYKLDAKSAQFHSRLKAEEQERELKTKTDEQEQLSRFRNLRKSHANSAQSIGTPLIETNITVPTTIKKRKVPEADFPEWPTETKKTKKFSPKDESDEKSKINENGVVSSLRGYTSSEEDEEEDDKTPSI